MQRNALIGIVAAIGAIIVVAPLGYAFAQRAAIASLDFDFNRFELTDIDFSDTQSFGSMQKIVANAESPSFSMLQDFRSIQSSMATPQTFALDLIANTRLTYSMFVDVHNPSSFEAIIDRAQVIVSINGQNLANPVTIDQQYRIGPGQTVEVELRGISVNGKEIAGLLFNIASDDFILTIDFAITSYFPTLLGEVSVPANVNVQMYLIPPKPEYVDFEDPYSDIQQVSFQQGSTDYKLSFANHNEVPISGKFEVGVLKGNLFSSVGLCDPACIAPIDNGFATFLRIKGSSVFDVQVFDSENLNLNSDDSYTFDITNPVLRSNANSAFIIRWVPDYEKIPYIMKSSLVGIEKSSSGEFVSPDFAIVRNIAYNIINNFGYVGSEEFVSPDTSTRLTLRSSDYGVEEGDSITFSGRLTDSYGRGIPDARIVVMEGDPIGDDFIAQGNTDDSGEFEIRWMAEDLDDFDNEQDIYATFSGNSNWEESTSSEIKVEVSSSGSTYQPPPEPESESTSLTLYASSYSVYEGDTVTLNGRLVDQDGDGVVSRTIIVKQDRSFDFDPEITSGMTDSDGFYSFDITVSSEGSYILYTIFEGSSSYYESRSNEIQIQAYAYEEETPPPPQEQQYQNAEITIGVSSQVVDEGDIVMISGQLTDENGDGIANAFIYLKDEDTGSGDDILETMFTDSNGEYFFSWEAIRGDPFDNVTELYTVFEGSEYYSQARSVQINVQVN